MENPEATERISKRAWELRSYELKYEPREIIKSQVLANFITDFTLGAREQADLLEGWILNMDAVSNSKGQASGLSSSFQKDLSLSNLLPSVSRHPTMKPSTRQS